MEGKEDKPKASFASIAGSSSSPEEYPSAKDMIGNEFGIWRISTAV